MILYKGARKVAKGTYWDVKTGRRIDVAEETTLPGGRSSIYLRMPPFLMLLLGPVLGLLYVVFLPVASIGVVIFLMVKKTLGAMFSLVSKLAYFEWRPAESYLSGKKKAGRKKGKTRSGGDDA